jgi:hypothetical protein
MLRTTSAEWTPWAIASAQAASTVGQAVGQNSIEDVDHLPIAIVGAGELAPHTFRTFSFRQIGRPRLSVRR